MRRNYHAQSYVEPSWMLFSLNDFNNAYFVVQPVHRYNGWGVPQVIWTMLVATTFFACLNDCFG